MVVDHDLFAVEAGSDRTHNHYSQYRDEAEVEVERHLELIASGRLRDAWVVRTAPDKRRRDELARYIGADDVILITAPRGVLIARAQERPDPIATVRAINRWFEVAQPSPRRKPHPSWKR